MRTLKTLTLVSALALSTPAAAEDYLTGNQMYDSCSVEGNVWCIGYVSGVIQGWQAALSGESSISARESYGLCIPDAVTVNQAVAVVARYLRDHPEERHWDAQFLVIIAVREAWPC
jgi:hypothetical protein